MVMYGMDKQDYVRLRVLFGQGPHENKIKPHYPQIQLKEAKQRTEQATAEKSSSSSVPTESGAPPSSSLDAERAGALLAHPPLVCGPSIKLFSKPLGDLPQALFCPERCARISAAMYFLRVMCNFRKWGMPS